MDDPDDLHELERALLAGIRSTAASESPQAAPGWLVPLYTAQVQSRALDHAAQGRLSVCDGCGGRIPLTRLRALPGTTRCVRCARADERES